MFKKTEDDIEFELLRILPKPVASEGIARFQSAIDSKSTQVFHFCKVKDGVVTFVEAQFIPSITSVPKFHQNQNLKNI